MNKSLEELYKKYWGDLTNEVQKINSKAAHPLLIKVRDEYVNGMDLNFIVKDNPFKEGEHLKVILSSITEDVYYYYFNMFTLLTETSGIGAAPPFPLYGNVVSVDENFDNALGCFQVRSTTEREITIID